MEKRKIRLFFKIWNLIFSHKFHYAYINSTQNTQFMEGGLLVSAVLFIGPRFIVQIIISQPTIRRRWFVAGIIIRKKIQILILVMASFAYRTDLGSKKRWKSVKAQERDERWGLWWVGGREDGGDISYGILVMAAQLLPGL
jgi:hypothetical protein